MATRSFTKVGLTTSRKLDINGGYNSDCSIITENPVLTILDGGGATRVFESESVSGGVSLRFLTFQNGSIGTNESGGGVLDERCQRLQWPGHFRSEYRAQQSMPFLPPGRVVIGLNGSSNPAV